MLGVAFGQQRYDLTILKDVEAEVHRNSVLQSKFPWFYEESLVAERLCATVRLTQPEKESISVAEGVFRASVEADPLRFRGGSPPSPVDRRVLAHGYVKEWIVTTDDLAMHQLAHEFEIRVWHGYDLLKALLNARAVGTALVKEIFEALEANGDLPAAWRAARSSKFPKLFGSG